MVTYRKRQNKKHIRDIKDGRIQDGEIQDGCCQ